MIPTIAAILIAYLLGGIPFGLLVARMYGIPDVRKHGSGNIGATNVLRVAGGRAAAWVYVADVAKGVVAVLIGKLIASQFAVWGMTVDIFLTLCALAAVIGHILPVYLKFKGGKGVNTTLGVMLVLLPIETLICLAIFAVVLVMFRMVSLASILATCSLFFILLVETELLNQTVADIYFYVAVALGILIIVTHRENILRIISGSESRITLPFGSGSK